MKHLAHIGALVLVLGLCLSPVHVQAASQNPGGMASAVAAQQKTDIKLRVVGCADCRIQPVQIKRAGVTYWGTAKTVTDDDEAVQYRVPTARTRQMTFLVYAPFDHWAQKGFPLTPITRFRAKSPNEQVAWTWARELRRASACWTGTNRDTMRNTLVIREITRHGETTAAGFFKRTMPSGRYWYTVRKASIHASDPSTCA